MGVILSMAKCTLLRLVTTRPCRRKLSANFQPKCVKHVTKKKIKFRNCSFVICSCKAKQRCNYEKKKRYQPSGGWYFWVELWKNWNEGGTSWAADDKEEEEVSMDTGTAVTDSGTWIGVSGDEGEAGVIGDAAGTKEEEDDEGAAQGRTSTGGSPAWCWTAVTSRRFFSSSLLSAAITGRRHQERPQLTTKWLPPYTYYVKWFQGNLKKCGPIGHSWSKGY